MKLSQYVWTCKRTMFWRIFREMTIFLWNSSCFYSFSWNCSSNLRYDVLTKFSLNYLAFFVCKTPYFYSFFSSTWAVYNYYCSFYELCWTVTWQLIREIFFHESATWFQTFFVKTATIKGEELRAALCFCSHLIDFVR